MVAARVGERNRTRSTQVKTQSRAVASTNVGTTPSGIGVKLPTMPPSALKKLEDLKLTYPGWETDYDDVFTAFQMGNAQAFNKSYLIAVDRQRVYNEYRSNNRLKSLLSLSLTYPGNDHDIKYAERWHVLNEPCEENDAIFQDMVEGLRNKERLFVGDRSHENLVELDGLELTYPGWEMDYQLAIAAHCESPSLNFPNAIHTLKEKERVHRGDRSHWRLAKLDSLRLTYPGWENDVKEIEAWHLQNTDSKAANHMFYEALEGIKDQQQIFLGWDHDSNLDKHQFADDLSSVSSNSVSSSIGSEPREAREDRNEKGRRTKKVKARDQEISKSVPKQEMREELVEKRPQSPAQNPSETEQRQSSLPPRPTGVSTGRSGPPTTPNFGQCIVCMTRPKTHVFVPCGHLCACAACSSKAMESNPHCPICRREATLAQRVFLT